MKSFTKLVSEVAQPKAGDEIHFKAKHEVEKFPHSHAGDETFKGKTAKAPKRRADHDAGEDAEVYEALDPVNKKAALGKFKDRADKDIDNDGDVDSSDKYLHARRKAITKAIHKEELDLSDFSVEEWQEFMESAEYDQLDEISKKTLGSYVKKASSAAASDAAKYGQQGSSEKGLGHFRKAYNRLDNIRKATDRLTKEEVEGLDEISRDTARSYIRKAMAHKTTGETPNKDRSAGVNLAGKKAYGIGGKAKVSATESVELDESEKKISALEKKIKDQQDRLGLARERRKMKGNRQQGTAEMNIQRKMDDLYNQLHDLRRAMKEEVEGLDESVSFKRNDSGDHVIHHKGQPVGRIVKTSSFGSTGYSVRIGGDRPHLATSKHEVSDESSLKSAKDSAKWHLTSSESPVKRESVELEEKLVGRQKELDHNKNGKIDAHDFHLMRKKKMKEEVEQLDELSPNTLHSYIKKAAGNMAGNAAVAAAQASSSMKKSSPDVKRNIRNRMRGITGASGRLADKANMAENAWEEVPMMMRQLQFIAYGAEEIMEYLDMDIDPEEWFQNKLAHVHEQMQTLHAYMEGDKRMMSRMGGMYREEVELDEVTDQERLSARKIQRDAQTARHGIARKPGESMVAYLNRAKKHKEKMQKEEAEVNEVTRSAVKRPVKYTDARGVTRTRMTTTRPVQRDQYGQEKIAESLQEAVKPGRLKLDDGSTITVSKKDADLVNQMFNDLNASNRKKMQDTMMSDKAGFGEIVGFAREAL
jgi:hypothetical protein